MMGYIRLHVVWFLKAKYGDEVHASHIVGTLCHAHIGTHMHC